MSARERLPPRVFPTPVGVFPDCLRLPSGVRGLPHARGGVSMMCQSASTPAHSTAATFPKRPISSFFKVTPPCPCPTAASAAPPVTTTASLCFDASRWPTTLRMEPQSMGAAEYAGATNAATPVTRRAPNQQLNPCRSSSTLSTRSLPPVAIGPSDGSHDYWDKALALWRCGLMICVGRSGWPRRAGMNAAA